VILSASKALSEFITSIEAHHNDEILNFSDKEEEMVNSFQKCFERWAAKVIPESEFKI
jgi:hypothetical protein